MLLEHLTGYFQGQGFPGDNGRGEWLHCPGWPVPPLHAGLSFGLLPLTKMSFRGPPFSFFSLSQPAFEYKELSLLLDAEHSKKSTSAPPWHRLPPTLTKPNAKLVSQWRC